MLARLELPVYGMHQYLQRQKLGLPLRNLTLAPLLIHHQNFSPIGRQAIAQCVFSLLFLNLCFCFYLSLSIFLSLYLFLSLSLLSVSDSTERRDTYLSSLSPLLTSLRSFSLSSLLSLFSVFPLPLPRNSGISTSQKRKASIAGVRFT